jgi:hypothetical protein
MDVIAGVGPMGGEDDGLRERFFKERRLLLALSVVLLAHKVLGITVGKSAETAGLHFEVEDPERLFIVVWFIWTWTLLCYLQHLSTMDFWKKFPLERRTVIHNAICEGVVFRRVRRDATRIYHREIPRKSRRGLQVENLGRPSANPAGGSAKFWLNCRVVREWTNEHGEVTVSKLTDVPRPHGAWISPWISHRGNQAAEEFGRDRRDEEDFAVPLDDVLDRRWPFSIAHVWSLASTSFFTDYVMPLLIAGGTVIAGVVLHFTRHSAGIWI